MPNVFSRYLTQIYRYLLRHDFIYVEQNTMLGWCVMHNETTYWEQVTFWRDERFLLTIQAGWFIICRVVSHWSTKLQVDVSLHPETLSMLLNCVCTAEKHQIKCHSHWIEIIVDWTHDLTYSKGARVDYIC